MNSICDLSYLPSDHSRRIIKEIIDKENLKDYRVTISGASKKGDNYLGELYRINVSGIRLNGKSEKLDFVMKLPPDDPVMREYVPYNRLYMKEVYAYTEIIPRFNEIQNEFNIPNKNRFMTAKCICASHEELKEFIVMEDLGLHGFVLYDRLKSLDYDHLALCVKNLAALHSLSFAMIKKQPELFKQMVEPSCQYVEIEEVLKVMFRQSAIQTVNIMDDEVSAKKLEAFLDDPCKLLSRLLKPEMAAPYNVICHGDCWSNNFLFKYEGNKPVEMRTVDWQIMRYASPVIDIAYMLFTSTDEETRNMHYPAILDLYYETLTDRLAEMDCNVKECYPKEIFKDQVKNILPYGLLMAMIILPLTQSDRGNAPDLAEILNEHSEETGKNILSQNCILRLRGVVKDFIKYEMI